MWSCNYYDELLQFNDTPIIRLNRAVAVGEADGTPAGLAALAEVDEGVLRRDAVAAHLHERNGDLEVAYEQHVSPDPVLTGPTMEDTTPGTGS